MNANQPIGVGSAVKRAVCLMILLAPMLGWTQSDGKIAPVSPGNPVESTKEAKASSPAMREVSFSQVHDRLRLSATQQSLWDIFKGRVDAYTGVYYRQMPSVPTPDDAATHQIGRMVVNLQNRLAALEEVEAAAKSLYESLSPEQQRVANELLILTIPTFLPSISDSIRVPADARRQEGKSDAGKRSRRGGGAMTGPLIEN
jgi:hypothetical protein